MAALEVTSRIEPWELAKPFRTSQFVRHTVRLLHVQVRDGQHYGQGESFAHERFGQTIEEAADLVSNWAVDQELPPGCAGAALDQALWDLRAKQAGRRAWELVGEKVQPVRTAITIGIDRPAAMAAKAAQYADWTLKIKVDAQAARQRVEAVRVGAPTASIVVDANESWSIEDYRRLAPQMHRLGVSLIEQPLPRGQDQVLAELDRPVPVCADESFAERGDLNTLRGYDAINIKLSKCGGLTAALRIKEECRRRGLKIFVGCMVSTSLAIAPAWWVAQGADFVDLDGPMHLLKDREPSLIYKSGGIIMPPPSLLWG